MTEPPHNAAPRTTSSDIDLYCLECGYNLRGLSGDPRRCPECGHLNPMGDLEIPAELISAQLEKLETAPAICVGATLAGGVFLYLAVSTIWNWRGWASVQPLGWFSLLLFVAVVVWLVGMVRFRVSCLHNPGWRSALLQYHLWALFLCVCVAGLLMTPMLVHDSTWAKKWHPQITIIGVGSFGAIFILATRPVHRRLKATLEPLQREVAVTIARDALKRRLLTGRRWWSK